MASTRHGHTRLIAANCVALTVLGFVTLAFSGPTNAQPGVGTGTGGGGGAAAGVGRPRGIYTLVSGRANGMTEHVVWVVDAANREVVAMRWNRNAGRFEPLGYRNLVDDAALQKRSR